MQYITPISIVICTHVHYYVPAEVNPLAMFCSVMPEWLLRALLIKRVSLLLLLLLLTESFKYCDLP